MSMDDVLGTVSAPPTTAQQQLALTAALNGDGGNHHLAHGFQHSLSTLTSTATSGAHAQQTHTSHTIGVGLGPLSSISDHSLAQGMGVGGVLSPSLTTAQGGLLLEGLGGAGVGVGVTGISPLHMSLDTGGCLCLCLCVSVSARVCVCTCACLCG